MTDDLPGSWRWSPGEASRPLSTGGYYMHYATRRKWANQHLDIFYEVRVDTTDRIPKKHHVQLALFEEDDTEIRELDILDYATIEVIDPRREASQRWAETQAHDRAIEMMAAVENGGIDG